MLRIGTWTVFGPIAALVVWWTWHAEYVVAFGRVTTTLLVVLLIGLPWALRRRLGPVEPSHPARLVRWGGYALVCALIPVIVWVMHYANARFADRLDHGPNAEDLTAGVLRCLLVGTYAVVILVLTSRHLAVPPRTLAAGGIFGTLTGLLGYGLTPLGGALHIPNPAVAASYFLALPAVAFGGPLLAGMLAAERIPGQAANPAQVRQATLAGLLTGILASLLITLCTISTMLIFPHAVTLEPDGLVYPPPDTPTERQMTIGDTAAGYQLVLFLGPTLGALAGMTGASIPRRRSVTAVRAG